MLLMAYIQKRTPILSRLWQNHEHISVVSKRGASLYTVPWPPSGNIHFVHIFVLSNRCFNSLLQFVAPAVSTTFWSLWDLHQVNSFMAHFYINVILCLVQTRSCHIVNKWSQSLMINKWYKYREMYPECSIFWVINYFSKNSPAL